MATNRIETALRIEKFGTLTQTRLPDSRRIECLKNQKWRTAAISKTINRLGAYLLQKAQLSPSDRAMRLVSSNLANYHATVQKLLIRQVLTKPMV